MLRAGVLASVLTPELSAPSLSLRILTIRCLRFRICVRDLLAPRLRPAGAEYCDTSVGRVELVSLPVLPDATDDAADFIEPNVDCMRDSEPSVSAGVLVPELDCSELPAQARKTASWIPGVKRESVR